MVQTGDGAYTTRCPFLEQTGDLFACAIYDTRPFICSNFTPGSSDLCPQYDFGSHPVVKQQISRDH